MEQTELTLSEYWRIIRKRRWTIIFVFLSVMISTIVFTKLQTPIYEARLELKIEKQQPAMTFGATSEGGSTKTLNLETEMRLINSLPVLRKVVERMEVLPAEPEEREKAIHAFSLDYQSRVQVAQIGSTDIVAISVTSDDKQNVALMATAIADVYIVENVEGRKKQSKALIQYIENQLDVYKKKIAEEENDLQKFQQNEKVFEVTKNIKETLDRLTIKGSFEFEADMLKIDRELTQLNQYIEGLKEKGGVNSKFLSMNFLNDNYIFIGLKRQLLELEFERFLLLIDYTDKHPAVVGQDQVVNEVKNKIVDMLKDFSGGSISANEEDALAVVIKKLFLETQKEVLYRIVNRFYEDSGSLSSNQLKYVSLKRNIEQLIQSYENLIKQRDEVKLNLAKVIDDIVTVVSPAATPDKPIKPKALINYLVGSVAGLLLGIVFCFVKESVDSSVSNISDVETELKLSILGIIPHMRKEDVLIGREEDYDLKDKKTLYQRFRLVTVMDPKSWPAESLKMLRTNLVQIMKTKNVKAFLFTSSDMQEGKSTVITNMALSMAQLGKKTVLIGSNMRRPTVYKIFGLSRAPGLSDILMGHTTWQEAINSSLDILTGGLDIDRLLQMPGIDNLKIITAGRPVDNVSELINSSAYDKLIRELKQHFDVIIIDCSPVMAVPDAISLCDKVDGVVLIYKVGQTGKDVLIRAKHNLEHAGANILGVVLNDIRTEAQIGFSAYYYRYYSETPDRRKDSLIKKWKDQFDRKRQQDEVNA